MDLAQQWRAAQGKLDPLGRGWEIMEMHDLLFL
jgi:hypothetical protein